MDNLPDRLTALLIRMNAVEQLIQQMQQQLLQMQQQFVLTNVNDIHLQNIRSTAERIENDMKALKEQLAELSSQLSEQKSLGEQREANQKQSDDQFKIKILWGVVSTVITVLVALLVAYLTNIIH